MCRKRKRWIEFRQRKKHIFEGKAASSKLNYGTSSEGEWLLGPKRVRCFIKGNNLSTQRARNFISADNLARKSDSAKESGKLIVERGAG